MSDLYYLVTIEHDIRRVGEENPMVRVVKDDDLQDFLYSFVRTNDEVIMREVEFYEP